MNFSLERTKLIYDRVRDKAKERIKQAKRIALVY